MRVKKWDSGEVYLWHCAWNLSPDCEDKNTTREMLDEARIAFEVDKISTGICEACLEVLEKLENNI
jgi:hypothetical protein